MLLIVSVLFAKAFASPACTTITGCGVHGHDMTGGMQYTDLQSCEAGCLAVPECKYFVFRTNKNLCGFKTTGPILNKPGRAAICGECIGVTTGAPTSAPTTGNPTSAPTTDTPTSTPTPTDAMGVCGFQNSTVCASELQAMENKINAIVASFNQNKNDTDQTIASLTSNIASLISNSTTLDAKLGTIAGSLNQYQNTTDATISSLVYNNTIVDANLHVTEKRVETLRHVVYGHGHNGFVAPVDHELNESFSCDERHVNSFQRCATQEQYLANGGLYAYQNQSESHLYVRRKIYGSGQVKYETGLISNKVCQWLTNLNQVGRRRLSEEELEEMYESAGLTDDERAQVQEHHDHVQSSERGRQLLGFVNCLQCTYSYRKASPPGELLIGEAVIPFTRTSPICPRNVGRQDLFGTSQFTTDKWLCVKDEDITGPNRKYDGITIDWVSCNTFEVIDFVDRITTSPTMAPPPVGR